MKNILVVDDVEVCRYTIAIAIEDQCLSYKGASTVDEAIDYLKSNRVDAIFLDWHLKKEQSTESLNEIKKLAGENAVICMMSAIEQERGQQLVDEHQVSGFLEKPIMKEQLINFLEQKAVI